MEDYKWIIVTVIAYLLALFWDILQRDKNSRNSPKRFDLIFFLKDNVIRLVFSLLFSCLFALLFWIVSPEVADMDNEFTKWGTIIYIVIGAAPDLLVSYLKRKSNKFLRVNEVDGYARK